MNEFLLHQDIPYLKVYSAEFGHEFTRKFEGEESKPVHSSGKGEMNFFSMLNAEIHQLSVG